MGAGGIRPVEGVRASFSWRTATLVSLLAASLIAAVAVVLAGPGPWRADDAAAVTDRDAAVREADGREQSDARASDGRATDVDASADADPAAASDEALVDGPVPDANVGDASASDPGSDPDPVPEPQPEPEPPAPILPPGPPSDQRMLAPVVTIGGTISPKSVVSTHDGLFLAQNMMYLHTITVYDRDHELVRTIPDTVELEDFGLDGPGVPVSGAPVEAAVTPDGAYAYISNYAMYGPGFDRPGGDTCAPDDGYDDSTVYRLDLTTLEIDQVIGVGSVPKYVAVTPDGSTVLVTNWCSYDLSVIDVERGEEVARLDIGRYPRGIAVAPDGSTAYIAVMGGTDIVTVDLDTWATDAIAGVGRSPRHVVISPDGDALYATLNAEGVVIRIDLATGDTTRVSTGSAPRSMDISADGRSLYVVNYLSDTVSKVRTSDMTVLQTVSVGERPIGITYDRATAEVWVASYSGTIAVFQDQPA